MRTSAPLSLLLLAACGNPNDGPVGGRLAYTNAANDITVLDLDSGAEYAIDPGAVTAGALSLSPDGRQLAFSQAPELFERQVLVGDIATGTVREVVPGTGEAGAFFTWGVGGYFLYYVQAEALDGLSYTYVVPAGEAARRLSDNWIRNVVSSPVEALVAYDECTERSEGGLCEARLVVEDVGSAEKTELTTGPLVAPVGFLPSGRELVSLEERLGATHLVLRSLDDSSIERDLGEVDGIPQRLAWDPDMQPAISPDGREVLAIVDGALVAVSTVDASVRALAPTAPDAAEFSGSGPAVWVVIEPRDDMQDAYNLHVDRNGESVRVLADAANCYGLPTLSVSGALVAWQCYGHVLIGSILDATVIADLETWDQVVGFDRADAGIVLSGDSGGPYGDLNYWTFDGTMRLLGRAYFSSGSSTLVEWPYYDLAP